jgi:hypothetical protein
MKTARPLMHNPFTLIFLLLPFIFSRAYAQPSLNQAPVLSGMEKMDLLYSENQKAVHITDSITITDADDANLDSAKISIISHFQPAEDSLFLADTLGIVSSWDAKKGILRLAGSSSIANYTTVLRKVTYHNFSDDPSDSLRTVSFIVSDGEAYSNAVLRNIKVTAVNDTPMLVHLEVTALTYTENQVATDITDSILIADLDSTDIVSATIAVTFNYQAGQDILAFTNTAKITGTWNAGSGSLLLFGTASMTEYSNALRNVSYRNSSDNPSTLLRRISFTVHDTSLSSNTVSRDIMITAVNDAPALTGLEGTPLAYTENQPATSLSSYITITDPDDTNIESAVISISLNYKNDQDVLAFTNTADITGSWDPVSGTMTLTGSDVISDYITALKSVTYQDTSDNPSTLLRTVSFTVNDGITNSNTVFRNISVSAVNDAPVLAAIETAPLSYNEGQGAVAITGSITVADVDNATLQSATISISSGYLSAEDTLTFATAGGLTQSWNDISGVLALTGNVSPEIFQTALRSVKYWNTSADPSTNTRIVTFKVNDGQTVSNTLTRNITISTVNNSPVLSGLETTPLSYTENDDPKQITGNITVSDQDDTNMDSARVEISANYQSDQDVLAFVNTSSIIGSWDAVGGILTLRGTANKNTYRNALRSVTYQNTSNNPSILIRTVSFTVNDGTSNSNTVSRTISITSVNDAPVLAAIETTPLIYTEGSAAVQISGTITVVDYDNQILQSATVTISTGYQNGQDTLSYAAGNGITPSWNASGGVLTLTGNVSPETFQTALRSVTYKNTSQNPSTVTRSVTFRVSDGSATSNTQSRNITVISVNNAPVLTKMEISALTYTENDATRDITDSLLISDIDDLNLVSATVAITSYYQTLQDTLIYNKASSPGIAGSWNAGSGVLTLTGNATLATYITALRNVGYRNTSDNPSSLVRKVTFRVFDGDSLSNAVSRSIIVVPVNDVPVLAGIEQTPITYSEGSGAVQVTQTITVSDRDNTNLSTATIAIITGYQSNQDVLSCSPIGGITIGWDPVNGILTLTGNVSVAMYQTALRSIRYENTSANPVVATRTVTFLVSDGAGNSIPVSRNISVGAVNNPPVLSGIETTPLSYTENDGAKDITDSIIVFDSDDASMNSATISFTSNYQKTEDVLSVASSPGITGTWNANNGILTLSGTATVAVYQAALRNVAYRNTSENPSSAIRTVSFKVFDGKSYSNVVSRTITVTAVNDPPVATNVTIIRANDRIGTLHTGSYTYSDPETGSSLPGTPIYKWYRKLPGGSIFWIDSVSVNTYTPVLKDGGDSICFEVTPVDNLGLAGNPVKSSYQYINAAPVAGDVHIFAPVLSVGHILYGRYNYTDKENNPAGNHSFQWYRSSSPTGSGTLIASAVDSTYKLILADENKYIRFVITPVATAGSTPGATVSSAWIGPVLSATPTAVISGSDTICSNGPKAKITVTLTGEPTWTITYRRSYSGKTEETTVRYITASPYVFDAPGNGTYTLVSVADNNYSSGIVSGAAVIGYYTAATAKLTGISQLCQESSSPSPLTVSLTGTAPWTFVVRRNTQNTTYSNITENPYTFNITNPGTYKIISLTDKYCTGDTVAGYGSVTINYITSPKATISGYDTVCPGDTAILQVKLEGSGPFSITYLKNGTNAKTVSNIFQQNYTLQVVGDGTYTLAAVSDKIRSGCVSGTGIVTHYAIPTANLSGSAAMCEYDSVSLRISLAGAPPWSFSYHRNTEVPTVVYPVASSPKNIWVSKTGTYTLVDVSDKHCEGTVSGSALITLKPSPVVTITGLKPAYSAETEMVPVFGDPDGGTFYPPVVEIQDTNYFFPKWAGPGVHTIVYSYRDPKTGCIGYDTAFIAVLSANADIIFPDNDTKKFFCYNDSAFTIQGRNTANILGSFSISGGVGLVDHGDNTATITPSELNGNNTYTVTYRYFSGATLEVKENFEVEKVGEIQIVGFDDSSYCQSPVPIRLNADVPGGVFSGNAVYGNQGSGYFFQSELTEPGPDTIFYTYTTSKGCSRQVYKSVEIFDTPLVNFAVTDSCIYYGISDSTAFINLTLSSDPVREWFWSFDDVGSGEKNNSSLENPKHKYSEAGRKDVSLQATTTNNCVSSRKINFTFEAKPSADFMWATECFQSGKKIDLINQTRGEITISRWKIFTGETTDSLFTKDIEYKFNAPGEYDIELFVSTGYGCADTVRRRLYLRPTYPLAEGASYFEGFESGKAGWISSSDTSGINSWILGKPDEVFGSSQDHAKAWYTHITAEWPPAEQSYITSPCFNFSGIVKPMIKFDMRRFFSENRDGAVLQYTADSGKHWTSVGKVDEGINWYNSTYIQSKPGGSVIGWSNVQDREDWVEARQRLDRQNGKDDVQFRFVYGSDGTAKGTNGLAFDNVWIGERNKISLIEHFTSTADKASRSADSILNALANSNPYDIVDIQYHTAFMGADPFNEANPVDPRTRASLYQVSAVPVSILNGGTTGKSIFDYSDKPLNTTFITNQSLADPLFTIDLRTTLLDNSIVAVADIRPLNEVLDRHITLHMAVIERLVSGVTGANGETPFESVLKILLPDTSFTNNWYPGTGIKTISRIWDFVNVYNPDEIRIIAFLQDENTREVYQAAINKYDLHTALYEKTYNPAGAGIGFVLFPNPVHHEVFIGFDEILDKKARADLFDMNGRLVLSCKLAAGNKLYTINLDDCTEGLFIIRITSENQFIGIQKMLLSR